MLGTALTVASCGLLPVNSAPPPVPVAPGQGQGQAPSSGEQTGTSRPKTKPSSPDDTPCKTAELDIKLYPEGMAHGGTGGVNYGAVKLVNTGRQPCTIEGFGRIATIGDTGPAIIAKQDPAHPAKKLTLKPGQGVVKDLTWERNGPDACPQPTNLEITPPGNSESITTPWKFGTICGALGQHELRHSSFYATNDSNGISIPGPIAAG